MHSIGRSRPSYALVAALATAVVGSGLVLSGVVDIDPDPIAVSSAAPAQDADHRHGDHEHASTLTDDGRFTGPDGEWPPRPKDATDVVTFELTDDGPEPTGRGALATADSPGATAVADAEVAAAIGDRFNLISVTEDEIVPGSAKDADDSNGALVTFFSLDRNQTVEAYLIGGEVVEVVISAASEYQPPLSIEEKDRAATLARAHWEAEGDGRIGQLRGYSILAVERDGTYYDSRVAYVSFHVDQTSRPELLAWVDLTSEAVVEARIDR